MYPSVAVCARAALLACFAAGACATGAFAATAGESAHAQGVEAVRALQATGLRGAEPDRPPATLGAMESFLLAREQFLAGGAARAGGADGEILEAALRRLATEVPDDPARADQLQVFLLKGYALLALSGVPRAASARVRVQSMARELAPTRNCTYLDSGGLKVIVRGDPTRKEVALTFDDGPVLGGPSGGTAGILSVLDDEDVKATFFLVGRLAHESPAAVRRIIAEGHAIGNHTLTHARMKGLEALDRRTALEEIATSDLYIRRASGLPSLDLFRPPYGSGMKDAKINQLVARYHLYTIGWSIDTKDWSRIGTSRTVSRVLRSSVLKGAIVLLHDHAPGTAEATREIIETLRPEGYTFLTIPQMLGIDPRSLYLDRVTAAATRVLVGRSREAYLLLMDAGRRAPSTALAREAYDFAYQIARVDPSAGDATLARRWVLYTLPRQDQHASASLSSRH